MGGTDAEDRASSGRTGQCRRTSRLPPAPRADTKAGSPRADRAPCRLGADQANPAVASTAPDSAKIIAERIFTIGRPGAVPENRRVVVEVYAETVETRLKQPLSPPAHSADRRLAGLGAVDKKHLPRRVLGALRRCEAPDVDRRQRDVQCHRTDRSKSSIPLRQARLTSLTASPSSQIAPRAWGVLRRIPIDGAGNVRFLSGHDLVFEGPTL